MGHLALLVQQGNNWVRQVGQPVRDVEKDASVLQVSLSTDSPASTNIEMQKHNCVTVGNYMYLNVKWRYNLELKCDCTMRCPIFYVIHVYLWDRLIGSWFALCSGEILPCWHCGRSHMSSRHLHSSSGSNKWVYISYITSIFLLPKKNFVSKQLPQNHS